MLREDGTLIFENHGADITYEGTSSVPLPVGLKISYYLDGEEITPEDVELRQYVEISADAEDLLRMVNLSDAADKKVKSYSGGMKQRLGIAQAELNSPLILILDELTAGLDPTESEKTDFVCFCHIARIILLKFVQYGKNKLTIHVWCIRIKGN